MGLLTQTLTTAGDDDARREFVRVTYYTLGGTMRDGAPTHVGAAACSEGKGYSLDFPRGTILELPDGAEVACEDTGYGDYYWKGWIDIWLQKVPYPHPYNDFEWVTVICWGPCESGD